MSAKPSRCWLMSALVFVFVTTSGTSAAQLWPFMAKPADEKPAEQNPGEAKPGEQKAKDLLTNLEIGEQLRRKRAFAESRDAWLVADEYVRAWEDEAKNSPEKLLQSLGEGIGSMLINDSVRRYDGADYERVALATRLALNHLALGDWDKARTEIRKMHEREAIIAEFRSKEVEALKSEREEKKVEGKEIKDLQGYPVETLDSPEVTSLKNSYQSAFGHYLAGFLYEQAGEGSLAAAGYRQAIELRPGVSDLESALAGLDQRVGKASPKITDSLFIIEAGRIPQKTSTTIPLPVPTHNGLVIVPMSFPSMPAFAENPVPPTIKIDGNPVAVNVVTSYDSMARRELKDSMPGVITRGTIRSIAKGVINSEMSKHAGIFGSIISSVLTTATETADVRMWSSLPSHVALLRVNLSPGKHVIEVNGVSNEVEVKGAYSLVAVNSNPPEPLITVATTAMVADVPPPAPEAAPVVAQAEAKAPSKKGAKGKKN